jgi:hypothetical protein
MISSLTLDIFVAYLLPLYVPISLKWAISALIAFFNSDSILRPTKGSGFGAVSRFSGKTYFKALGGRGGAARDKAGMGSAVFVEER